MRRIYTICRASHLLVNIVKDSKQPSQLRVAAAEELVNRGYDQANEAIKAAMLEIMRTGVRAKTKFKVTCNAKTRRGTPCQCKALVNGRCKFHGGLSTGARTQEGIERIRQAQLKRWQRYRDRKAQLLEPI